MLGRIWQIIIKELIQFRRDRILMLFLLIFPTLQLALMARVAGGGISHLALAVLDEDRSAISRRMVEVMDNTETLILTHVPESRQEVTSLLDRGEVAVAVLIPPHFAADLYGGKSAPAVQIIADGSNTYAASTALRAAEGAIRRAVFDSLAVASAAGEGGPLPAPPVDLRVTVRFNPAMKGEYYNIPAQFAFIVYQVALIVSSMGLVRERELGTLEQLVVTPARRIEVLVGKAIPFIAIGLVEFSVMLWVVTHLFAIPMNGSRRLLYALTTLFIVAEVFWGMMISALARTQQQAILIVFPVAMVELSVSGFLVPVENMPLGLRIFATFTPLRHYMTIVRDVMIKGATLTSLWPNALALLLLTFGVAFLGHRNVARTFE